MTPVTETPFALTVSEACKRAGIGRTRLYKFMSEGKLTPRKAGTRTLIIVEELDHLIRSLPTWDRG